MGREYRSRAERAVPVFSGFEICLGPRCLGSRQQPKTPFSLVTQTRFGLSWRRTADASKTFAVLAWRHSGTPLKDFPEKCRILVSDREAHGLQRTGAVLEHLLGDGDAQGLHIVAGQPPRGALEAPDEIAGAHPEIARQIFDRDVARIVLLDVGLGGTDLGVVVRPRERQGW
jgi:hypothetical protein